jgi:flagellar biosynthetic protein FliQ
MTEPELLDILRDGVITALLICAPPILSALFVGVTVSLVQALTSLQEQTIAFIPKIIAVFLSLVIFMPYMLHTLQTYTMRLTDHIISGQ